VRTRIRESSRFHAGLDGLRARRTCTVRLPQNTGLPPATSALQVQQ